MEVYKPGTMIGNYEIVSTPMMGGMGVVYFCLDHGNNGKPVALKTFRPEFLPDREARDRFLREGTAWVNLGSHPHIVRCHKVQYIDPTAFLVLELIAKQQGMEDASLRSWMGSPIKVDKALLFALQIARGLQHATTKIPGFVHRDLKPENILIGADKLPGTNVNRLRVTDFGLATMLKDEGGKLTDEEDGAVGRTHLTRGIVGTPLYMAPEQWMGEDVGVYTDVYALGCILYEMLTGKCIVDGRSINDLRSMHCEGKLRTMPENMSREVKLVLGRCISFRPAERYLEWGCMTQELEQVCAGLMGDSAPAEMTITQISLDERLQEGWSYKALGSAYKNMGKVEIAKDYYEKFLSIAREVKDLYGEVSALDNLGTTFEYLGETQHAIEYHEQALIIAREIGDRLGEAYSLGNLGNAYVNSGEVRRAIECQEQVLVITREVGDRLGEEISLGNLGVAYANLGEVRRAIEYFENELEIACVIEDRRGEGRALGNLGNAHAELEEFQRAIGCYKKRIEIAREMGDRRGEAYSLGNLGEMYRRLGEVQHAILHFEQAIVIQREIGNMNGVAAFSFNMAILYAGQGKTSHALLMAQEAERIWFQIGNPDVQRAQQFITELKSGKFEQSGSTEGNVIQAAFEVFQRAASSQDMQVAVTKYRFMKDKQFIQAIGEIIKEQVPSEQKPAFEQKLSWLKYLATK